MKQQIYIDNYKNLNKKIDFKKYKSILLICSNFILDSFFYDYITKLNLPIHIFTNFSPNPKYEEVLEGIKIFKENKCDFLIAVGGGSALDVAKAIKAFVFLDENKNYLEQKIVPNNIPLLAVPTTAGTGSEATKFAVIYYAGAKQSLEDESLLPDYVILEPKFLESLPEYQKKSTLLDALCHAIESYWSINATKESRKYAKQSLEIILKNYKDYLNNPTKKLNSEILKAANLSGKAINISKTTAAHAMSYKITSIYGLSHGHAAATCLPLVWKYMLKYSNKELDKIFNDLDKIFKTTSHQESINKLYSIYDEIGLKYKNIVNKEDLDKLVETVNINRLKNSPVPLTQKDVKKIYSKLVIKENKTFKKSIKNVVNKIPFIKKILNYLLLIKRKVVYKFYKIRYKTNDKIIIFSSFWSKKYNCNPKGIYEALLKNKKYNDYKFVWVFKNPKQYTFLNDNHNTTTVRLYSKKYYKYCAQAKYFITNVSLPSWVTPKKDQIYINTWHGKPMKKIGCNIDHSALPPKKLKKQTKGFKRNGKIFTYLFSPAPFFTAQMATAYGLGKDSKKVIEVGYPRNDFLFTYTAKDAKEIKDKLNIKDNKKVIFYAPTWRNYEYDTKKYSYTYQNHLDFDKLIKQLGNDYVILFKAHNQEENSADISNYKNVIDVSSFDDINELYIISDLMISDYSGAIFDYANLHRPMVYYMWDKDEYVNESQGIDFDFNELPGEIVTKEENLASAIKNALNNFKYDEKYKKFNERYNCLDGKDCGNKFIEKYIK